MSTETKDKDKNKEKIDDLTKKLAESDKKISDLEGVLATDEINGLIEKQREEKEKIKKESEKKKGKLNDENFNELKSLLEQQGKTIQELTDSQKVIKETKLNELRAEIITKRPALKDKVKDLNEQTLNLLNDAIPADGPPIISYDDPTDQDDDKDKPELVYSKLITDS